MMQAQNMWILMEELARHGVNPVCVAPGSRSTPIVLAAVENGISDIKTFHDERSCGFVAVGLARAGALPAVVTTSGTAVANLLPSVVEANADRLPVIYITADRPSGAHGRGANQTVQQRGIFSSHVAIELALDAANMDPEAFLREVSGALCLAQEKRRPVHINVHLEKPLETIATEPPQNLSTWFGSGERFQKPNVVKRAYEIPDNVDLLVVGQCDSDLRRLVKRFEQTFDGDRFYDVQSGSQTFGSLLLSNPRSRGEKRYRHALVVGRRFTEHRIWEFLRDQTDRVTQLVDVDGTWDPIGVVDGTVVKTSEPPLHAAQTESTPSTELDHRTIVTEIWETPDVFSNLFVGNSLVIRAFDRFRKSGPFAWDCNVYANRGASGIDGNLSTAAGIALSSHWPTLCVVGDQTLLHDIGALTSLKGLGIRMRVVVIDNRGGRIFEHLPTLDPDVLNAHYIASPDVDVAAVCRGFGLRVEDVDTVDEFRQKMREEIFGVQVLVARIDPVADRRAWGTT